MLVQESECKGKVGITVLAHRGSLLRDVVGLPLSYCGFLVSGCHSLHLLLTYQIKMN